MAPDMCRHGAARDAARGHETTCIISQAWSSGKPYIEDLSEDLAIIVITGVTSI